MSSLEEIRIQNVVLNQPFELPCNQSEFLFQRLTSNASTAWCLIDLRTPSSQNLQPSNEESRSWVELSGLDQFARIHNLPMNQAISAPDSLNLDLHMHELRKEFVNASPNRKTCMQLLFALILLDFQRLSDASCTMTDLLEDRLEQVIHRMLSEYRHPWRVEDLSELLNVSPSY